MKCESAHFVLHRGRGPVSVSLGSLWKTDLGTLNGRKRAANVIWRSYNVFQPQGALRAQLVFFVSAENSCKANTRSIRFWRHERLGPFWQRGIYLLFASGVRHAPFSPEHESSPWTLMKNRNGAQSFDRRREGDWFNAESRIGFSPVLGHAPCAPQHDELLSGRWRKAETAHNPSKDDRGRLIQRRKPNTSFISFLWSVGWTGETRISSEIDQTV